MPINKYLLKFHWKYLLMGLPKSLQGDTMLLLHTYKLSHVFWGYSGIWGMEEHDAIKNKTVFNH